MSGWRVLLLRKREQVCEVVNSILTARPSLQAVRRERCAIPAIHSCAACGVRPIATPLSPHRRIALDDLVRVFEYESVLAASAVSTKAAAAALFTKKQMERICNGGAAR